jgi:hypothetical protein
VRKRQPGFGHGRAVGHRNVVHAMALRKRERDEVRRVEAGGDHDVGPERPQL